MIKMNIILKLGILISLGVIGYCALVFISIVLKDKEI